ncbi:acyl-CoA dehydrogenase [Penicillium sp. IBT 35674x]|nr:acyl-CoA dehydrogenase [Penicillium sp. IBT 35674x]
MALLDSRFPALVNIPLWAQERLSERGKILIHQVLDWVETECTPAETVYKAQVEQNRWVTPPIMRELREKAKRAGLFNLFLPKTFEESPGLTNLEYSCCAEIMGRTYWAAQTMNCHAPETGNIELLAKYCNAQQKKKWLQPLLDGETCSAYSMTEPHVASSDATQISCQMVRDGDHYVINGHKLFGNCSYNRDMTFFILMVLSDPRNPNPWRRHSMIIVPADTPGLTIRRNLTIMGYDWAPEGHGEYIYENCRVPVDNIILGEGRAFEIAQGRLGPGRIHHCMRLLGSAERAFELALIRCTDENKMPRGRLIGDFDSNIERIASMRLELDALRLTVLNAANTMDILGNKAGRYVIAQSKILVPTGVARIIDECMQMYGGQGLTQHTPLPEMWTYARLVRIADGPDAAHRHQVGRDQLKKSKDVTRRHKGYAALEKQILKRWNLGPDCRAKL